MGSIQHSWHDVRYWAFKYSMYKIKRSGCAAGNRSNSSVYLIEDASNRYFYWRILKKVYDLNSITKIIHRFTLCVIRQMVFDLYIYQHHPKWLTWWRHQMETFSALLALYAGNFLWPVNSPHKGQGRGVLRCTLICTWINGWVNSRETGDLRRHRAHYDDIFMRSRAPVGLSCSASHIL